LLNINCIIFAEQLTNILTHKTCQIGKFCSTFANETGMKIINAAKLYEFVLEMPDAESAINRWVQIVNDSNWTNHHDLKRTFISADYVGNTRYVINIRGNNYRLVAVVVFFAGFVDVRFIGKHKDYDKIDCLKI
jgi:mRNA interferase HigB